MLRTVLRIRYSCVHGPCACSWSACRYEYAGRVVSARRKINDQRLFKTAPDPLNGRRVLFSTDHLNVELLRRERVERHT
jgi:hypothetical protein